LKRDFGKSIISLTDFSATSWDAELFGEEIYSQYLTEVSDQVTKK
jgi:hypothetical protein